MSWWLAAAMGVVQGVTEFLPISSSAHLRILPALVGQKDPGASFTAVIQNGTIFSVLIYFKNDLVSISKATLIGIFRKNQRNIEFNKYFTIKFENRLFLLQPCMVAISLYIRMD